MKTFRVLAISLRGMGTAAALGFVGALLPYALFIGFAKVGDIETAKSLFWQFGYFPTAVLGCWWVFLFLRVQFDSGAEMVLIRMPGAPTRVAMAFSAVYGALMLVGGTAAVLLVPDERTFLLLETVQLVVRSWFFSALLLAPAALTGSVDLGLVTAFVYGLAGYMMLYGVLPLRMSGTPLIAAPNLGAVLSANAFAAAFVVIAMLVSSLTPWRFSD